VLAALVVLVLERTPYGRRLYALGSNPGAAPLALIDPVRMWVITYAASAFFAAVAGVLLLGFTGSAYGDVGQPYLFQTIAAVVVGGAALVGGRGSYLGTIAGVLVLTEINTLLIGLGFQPSAVQAALGLIIVLLVSLYGRERHVSATI
jgi:ribose transport system permease protein